MSEAESVGKLDVPELSLEERVDRLEHALTVGQGLDLSTYPPFVVDPVAEAKAAAEAKALAAKDDEDEDEDAKPGSSAKAAPAAKK